MVIKRQTSAPNVTLDVLLVLMLEIILVILAKKIIQI